jgi:signal transduction histidine kinase
VTGRNIYAYVAQEGLLPKRLLEQGMLYVRRAFSTGKPQIFEQHLTVNGKKADFEVRIVASGPDRVLAIVRDITLRKRLEQEILEISGREQRRIGQDLHDSLCQHLAGVGFMAKVMERQVAAGQQIDMTHASEMVNLIDQAITLTRGFARGLNPVRLEAEGLAVALTELAANTVRIFGIKCQFRQDQAILVHDNSTATHLYRIVQEALNNAIKHGKPDTVTINFETDGKLNMLSVKDNGIGIDLSAAQGRGMGLNIMNYRASMIGAAIEIKQDENGGTVVLCSFPDRK